jgi:hypothetical protein
MSSTSARPARYGFGCRSEGILNTTRGACKIMYSTRYHPVAYPHTRNVDQCLSCIAMHTSKHSPLLDTYQHIHLVHLALFSGEHIHTGSHHAMRSFCDQRPLPSSERQSQHAIITVLNSQAMHDSFSQF